MKNGGNVKNGNMIIILIIYYLLLNRDRWVNGH